MRCLLGVLTDEHLETNVPGIYAAGDCAEAFDKVSRARPSSARSSPTPPSRRAWRRSTWSGRKAELLGVTQINVLDTLGLISASFGKWDGVPGGQQRGAEHPRPACSACSSTATA